jgi:hypothetical protein
MPPDIRSDSYTRDISYTLAYFGRAGVNASQSHAQTTKTSTLRISLSCGDVHGWLLMGGCSIVMPAISNPIPSFTIVMMELPKSEIFSLLRSKHTELRRLWLCHFDRSIVI